MRLTIFFCLITFFTLVACAPVDKVEPTAGAAEKDVQTSAVEDDQAYLQDIEMMAADLGIPVEEARRRVENDDAITELQARLRADEADTFAGLWVEHEPQYRIVAAFRGDAQEILRRYIDSDHPLAGVVEARNVTYTYEQLQADQQAAGRLLQELALTAASAINVQENQVEIYTSDRAAYDAALAAAGADLPPSVAIVTVYEPLGETPPFALTPVPEVFMPQLKQRDVAFMEALLSGELVVDQGCLRVQGENESHLVIWQADYFLTDNNGTLQILDETGEVAARVGERVYMGGGEQAGIDNAELRQPLPEQCGGPYWRMGEFLPEEYIPQETAVPPTSEPAAIPAAALPDVAAALVEPLLIDGERGRIYAAGQVNGQPGTVVLDTEDGRLLSAVDVAGQLALDRTHNRLFIDQGANGLQILEARTLQHLGVVSLPPAEEVITPQVDPITGLVYAFRERTAYEIDPQATAVIQTWELSIPRTVCGTRQGEAAIWRSHYDLVEQKLYLAFLTTVCTPHLTATIVAYHPADMNELGRYETPASYQAVPFHNRLHGTANTSGLIGRSFSWAWNEVDAADETSSSAALLSGIVADWGRGLIYEAVNGRIRVMDPDTRSVIDQREVDLLTENARLAGHDPHSDNLYFLTADGRLQILPAAVLFQGVYKGQS